MVSQIREIFQNRFGNYPVERIFFSPGRVNLIGEHIDYNGGFVFPIAISLGNYGAIAKRNDQTIRMYSQNFPHVSIITASLSDLDYRQADGWGNYAKGVIQEMIHQHYPIAAGFDIAIMGNLPSGAGLSSSASIELLIATMMNAVFKLGISKTDLSLLCKKVENEYIHVNCGIMDQFVIANGKKDHALLLNTNSLEYIEVPIHLQDYDIVICNSKVKRGLVDSKYNLRRQECNQALEILEPYTHAKFLCDISYPDFVTLQPHLHDDTLLKRARHVITENHRTLLSHKLLVQNDILSFGEALLESHYSLRMDYEVSCPELDFLVEAAMNNGSIGSRMTGAGFGGCTVNIVKKSKFNYFKEHVTSEYENRFHITPDILVANPEDGCKEIV